MAVIATNGSESKSPESALIAFAELQNLEIIFETFKDSRKYQNLKHDKHVSLVVGFDPKHHITLQYEGVASPVTEDEKEKYIELFLAKDTPCTEKFLRDLRVQLYKIKPTWLCYSDYSKGKPEIIELKF